MALPTNFPNGVASYGVPLPTGSSFPATTGSYFFVQSTIGSNSYSGTSTLRPFSTIAYAISRCQASHGDVVVVMPGHAETVTTQIVLNVVGVQIAGLGYGDDRPTLTNALASADETISVTVDDCTIQNLVFANATTASTPGAIEIAVGADDVKIYGCTFYQGANDLRAIRVTGAALRLEVSGCNFYVTANGPTFGFDNQGGALSGLKITNCYFNGGSTTNSWDNEAVSSTQADTGVYLDDITFIYGAANRDAVAFTSATSTGFLGNVNITEYSQSSGINCGQFAKSKEIDLQIPTDQVTVSASGGGLPYTTGKYIFVDSVTGASANDGLDPSAPVATLAQGLALATANKGDVVVLFPGHAETITTTISLSVAGILIHGIRTAFSRPTITMNGAGGAFIGLTFTVGDARVRGLTLTVTGGAVTAGMIVNAGVNSVIIEDCIFDMPANARIGIDFAGASAGTEINGCRFEVTANGPTFGIRANGGALTRCFIHDNYFDGNSTANSFDNGCIVSTTDNIGLRVYNNTCLYLPSAVDAISLSSVLAEGAVYSNYIAGNAVDSGILAPSMLVFANGFENTSGSLLQSGEPYTTGKYIFVDSEAGTASGNGLTLNSSVPTLAAGIALAGSSAKDTIIVLPGHSETIGSLITVGAVGAIEIIGLGIENNRPNFTVGYVGSGLNVTGAQVKIKNILFNTPSAAATANITVSAAQCTIEGCKFDLGANAVDCILWASGADLRLNNNHFNITANGPARGLSITGTNDGLICTGNYFNGGSATNAWDVAAINSTVAHTNALITGNKFLYGIAHITATSVSTTIRDNIYGVGSAQTATTPKVIYVDNGTTIRDGLVPSTPTTFADAMNTLARSGAGDTIQMMPGTYTLTTTITFDKNATILKPYLDNGTFNVTITTASDVDLLTVTAANSEISGIRFLGNAAMVTTPVCVSYATGDFNRIHDCFFDCANVAALQAVTTVAGSTDNKIDRNYFTGQVAGTSQISDLGARTKVWDNYFDLQNTTASAWTNDTAATAGSSFLRNYILGDGGARTAMIIPDSTAPVQFLAAHNIFGGTTSAIPFSQDTEWTTMFVENYVASGTGSTVVDPVA